LHLIVRYTNEILWTHLILVGIWEWKAICENAKLKPALTLPVLLCYNTNDMDNSWKLVSTMFLGQLCRFSLYLWLVISLIFSMNRYETIAFFLVKQKKLHIYLLWISKWGLQNYLPWTDILNRLDVLCSRMNVSD